MRLPNQPGRYRRAGCLPALAASARRSSRFTRWGIVLLALILAAILLPTSRANRPTPELPVAAPAMDAHGAASTAAAAPLSRVLLYDSFTSSQTSRLLTSQDRTVRFGLADGGYRITVRQPHTLAWSRLADDYRSYQDIAMQVETVLLAGSAQTTSSLLFRYQDDNNYYLFNVAYNGFYNLEVLEDGHPTRLIDWTPSAAIQTAPWVSRSPPMPTGPPELTRPHAAPRNLLRVVVQGNRIGLFVNGVRLEETLDRTFRRGGLALAVQTFAVPAPGAATIHFDNLLVTTSDRIEDDGKRHDHLLKERAYMHHAE